MKYIALIPAYEPDENLEKVVKELKKKKFEIIVVNDGSDDSYNKFFDACNTKVISYNKNQGKGYALKTGLKYIKEHFDDYIVVTMDSDGQHTVKDATKLCKYIEKHPKELVLGKRIRNEKTPLRSKLGNAITRFIFRLISGQDIYDTQTGLRAFTKDVLDYHLQTEGNRFEYEMNILLNAKNNNIKISEIEIETIYIDKNSKSHFNTIKDSYRVYKEIFKFSLSGIISFLIDYCLFSIFLLTINNVVISNVIARIISATVNYSINRNLVFKNKNSIYSSLIKYIVLALFIIVLNTTILKLLSIFINPFIAKVLTEIILFFISYLVQSKIIFKRSNYGKD